MSWEVRQGDALVLLRGMEPGSVDAIVTDPPYGLEFMGKDWDAPWKNGFASYGMQDSKGRMAGPQYGGNRNAVCVVCHKHQRGRNRCACATPQFDETASTNNQRLQSWYYSWAREALRVAKPGVHLVAFGGTRTYHRLACAIEDAGWEIRDCLMWLYGSGFPKSKNIGGGWGTALKPAWEPIILARKPLVGTVATNVLEHGTGALNVDGCRIGVAGGTASHGAPNHKNVVYGRGMGGLSAIALDAGRWPANLVLDEEAAAMLDEQSGTLQSGYFSGERSADKSRHAYGAFRGSTEQGTYGDSGGASRFYYTAKASSGERHYAGRNTHPTVKPVELMRWLVRLVTPPGGLVLDPFTGSGSTGVAALAEGARFLGMELDPEHVATARRRIAGPLFAETTA